MIGLTVPKESLLSLESILNGFALEDVFLRAADHAHIA
jgi:hypothetical protein